jgi:signal transduction histidine kinase
MRRLLQFREVQGVRLNTPDRDGVWSLFAFHDQDKREGIKREELLQMAAHAIEDACWHEHLEQKADEDRDVYEKGQRIREIGHEVKHGADDLKQVTQEAVELLTKDDPDPQRAAVMLQDIEQRCSKLHHLAERLLGRMSGKPEKVGLLELMKRCTLPYAKPKSPRSRAPGVLVPEPMAKPKDLLVWGDEALVEVVLDNLLRNAVQAVKRAQSLRMPGEEGLFGQVCLEACPDDRDNDWVRIYVHDTGDGISRHVRLRMWDRGYTRDPKGTGLGMSICQFAVDQLEADLEIDYTSLFVGTTFVLRLPRA